MKTENVIDVINRISNNVALSKLIYRNRMKKEINLYNH